MDLAVSAPPRLAHLYCNMNPQPPAAQRTRPWLWTFTTYFAEGFPYTLIRTVSSVFFRDAGMSLQGIGLTSLYGLPWIIKFLWGPHVDTFSTKKRWMLVCQGGLATLMLLAAGLIGLQDAVTITAIIFFAGSFLAATHDIAIDGYYMEALDEADQARFVGYRVMAYRIAMMTGTGVVVTLGALRGWHVAYGGAALLLAGLTFFHWRFLPECQHPGKQISELFRQIRSGRFIPAAGATMAAVYALYRLTCSDMYAAIQQQQPILKKFTFAAWIGMLLFAGLLALLAGRRQIRPWLARHPDPFFAEAFLSYMERPRIGVILAFIIFIRTGEFMLSAMVAPFMVDLGLKVHYGWISGGIGLPASIAGAMLGGALIARHGLRKMVWPFLLAQNLTNLVYMALALHLSPLPAAPAAGQTTTSILVLVAAVHGFDQFAGGLGTAVLMTYLMRLCDPRHKAAHYAIGTGLMSVSGLYAGVLSGFLASALGYGWFFGVSFLFSVPGLLLLPFVPLLDQRQTG